MPDWDESESCTPIDVFLGIQGRPPGCDKLIGGLARLAWPQYVAATQAVLADSFVISDLHARADALETHLEDAVAEDPNLGITVAEWRTAVNALKSSMTVKRNYIENKIAQ
jgi:hypothetical protein